MNINETIRKIEPYLYVKKFNNIHYLIHVITDVLNYAPKVSCNIYTLLMFHNIIKDPKEIVLIYEIDPFKEINNVTCIKHINNEVNFVYDRKELEAIFPDLVKNGFNDEMYVAVYDYETIGYYFQKTTIFHKLFNLNTGVNIFPINTINYFACVKPFLK